VAPAPAARLAEDRATIESTSRRPRSQNVGEAPRDPPSQSAATAVLRLFDIVAMVGLVAVIVIVMMGSLALAVAAGDGLGGGED
jgi:hypothetical protein